MCLNHTGSELLDIGIRFHPLCLRHCFRSVLNTVGSIDLLCDQLYTCPERSVETVQELKVVRFITGINDLRVAMRGLRSLFWIWVKRDIFRRGESLR
jgi:hypothetical protein